MLRSLFLSNWLPLVPRCCGSCSPRQTLLAAGPRCPCAVRRMFFKPDFLQRRSGAMAITSLNRFSDHKVTRPDPIQARPVRRASCLSLTPFVALLALAISLCAGSARAQELAATLSGAVTDSSGAVLPNAKITITLNEVGGASREVETDSSGNFTATNLTAGSYTVTVVAPGFATFTDKNLVLYVAQKRTMNAQLKPGAASTTIEVQENPVAIETTSSSQAGTITGEQVRDLELINRNFQQLVTLQPGVVNLLGDEPGFGLSSVSSSPSTAHAPPPITGPSTAPTSTTAAPTPRYSTFPASIQSRSSPSSAAPMMRASAAPAAARSSSPPAPGPSSSMARHTSSPVPPTPTPITTSTTSTARPAHPTTTITSDSPSAALSSSPKPTTPTARRPSSSGPRSGAKS